MGSKLIDHICNLLGLQQLTGLDMLGMHLTLLCAESMDIFLDILEAGVHKGDIFLEQ